MEPICLNCKHFIAENDKWATCHRDMPRRMSDGTERYLFVLFFEGCEFYESKMILEPPIDLDNLLKDVK